MTRWRILASVLLACLVAVISVNPVLAHDAPDEGAEWLMADWMLFAFLIFAGAALVTFVIVAKRGLLHKVEEAKYYILTINEPDYYTPEWAREGKQQAQDDTGHGSLTHKA